MTMVADFFDKIGVDAGEQLFALPIFHRFDEYNDAQLRLFSQEFYHYVKAFPNHLCYIIARSENEEIRHALLMNLMDELGGKPFVKHSNSSGAHYNTFKRFASAVGLTDEDLQQEQKTYTKKFNMGFVNYYQHAPFLCTVASIAPGIEYLFSGWMKLALQGLIKQNRFTREELFHFHLHVKLDEHHVNNIKKAIIHLLEDSFHREQIVQGVRFTLEASIAFFKDLYQDMLQVADEGVEYEAAMAPALDA